MAIGNGMVQARRGDVGQVFCYLLFVICAWPMAMEWCKPRKGDVGRVSARKHCLHSRKTNHDDADLDHERYDDGDDTDN